LCKYLGQLVDVARGIRVENILGGLDARARAFPELDLCVFRPYVEVEVVFVVVNLF